VVASSVSVEKAQATLYISLPQDEARAVLPEICAACTAAGFAATVGDVQGCQAEEPPAKAATRHEKSSTIVSLASSWPGALVAGLLSSSCCLLQLAFNALSAMDLLHVGCAGFNKTLGPIRWHLRGVTLLGLGCVWLMHLRSKTQQSQAKLMARTVFTLLLMFLPELLLMGGGPALAPPTGDIERYELQLEGMGCEACQLHVQKVLESTSGVVGAEVNFKTGRAEVLVAKDWAFDINATQTQLTVDGYTILDANKTATTSRQGTSLQHPSGQTTVPVPVKLDL